MCPSWGGRIDLQVRRCRGNEARRNSKPERRAKESEVFCTQKFNVYLCTNVRTALCVEEARGKLPVGQRT